MLLTRFIRGMRTAALMVLVLLIALGLWAYFGMESDDPIAMLGRVYTTPFVWILAALFCLGAGLISLFDGSQDEKPDEKPAAD